jgi:hypothetical protein
MMMPTITTHRYVDVCRVDAKNRLKSSHFDTQQLLDEINILNSPKGAQAEGAPLHPPKGKAMRKKGID